MHIATRQAHAEPRSSCVLLVPSARRSAISWQTRRPSGKARRGRILDVCNRGATLPDGMDRRPNAGGNSGGRH
jgi:hypothetical protein